MRVFGLVILVACGGKPGPDAPDAGLVPTRNLAREVLDTRLAVDVTALTATATVTFGPSAQAGATVEVGDLAIGSVQIEGADVAFATDSAKKLDLALPASDQPLPVTFTYAYKTHGRFDGAAASFTFLWPYHCGNLFPCHSDPDDGTTFSLELAGVPADKTAIFAPTITEAPSYQVAWAIDAYVELALGTTTAGTQISLFHRANEATQAQTGGANLVAVFDWLEQNIGPYRFGTKAGGVSITWPIGGFGGMEHHPLWHVARPSFASQETQAHEAAHGWYGDGIRIACWEDFVLSEGTVTYLAGRALEVVAPTVGQQVWTDYGKQLAGLKGTELVWPEGCKMIDILEDGLYQTAPYIRGAFFYRALAGKVGAAQVDQVLATFYAAHAGKPARMTDMLATIQQVTGYDATTCANSWLRSTTIPAPDSSCP